MPQERYYVSCFLKGLENSKKNLNENESRQSLEYRLNDAFHHVYFIPKIIQAVFHETGT